MANVVSAALVKDLLAASLSGSTHPLSSLSVGLYTNNATLNEQTLIGDLTEATYDGYSRNSVTWSNIFDQPDGSYAVQGSLGQFQMTDALVPQSFYGYFVCQSSGSTSVLVWSEAFADPIGFASTDDSVIISPQFVMGGSNFGSGTVIN